MKGCEDIDAEAAEPWFPAAVGLLAVMVAILKKPISRESRNDKKSLATELLKSRSGF